MAEDHELPPGGSSSPKDGPSMAQRVTDQENTNHHDDRADAANDTTTDGDNNDDTMNRERTDTPSADPPQTMQPPDSPPKPDTSQQSADADDSIVTGGGGGVDLDMADATINSSALEAAPVDPSRLHDDSLTEEAVREHLQDVESSFLPALSPIPTGLNHADGGVDDTYLFDAPNRAAMQDSRRAAAATPQPEDSTTVSNTTSNLENLDSSPTAAAAARTISRAVSMASNAQHIDQPRRQNIDSDRVEPTEGEPYDRDEQDDSLLSSTGEQEGSLSRSHSQSERFDAGSTPGHSLRGRRPKYLRSRISSQRSSTSSFATNPESQDGSEATALGYGADYALQSGGAAPASGLSSRNVSNSMLSRPVSMGSVASGFGFDDYTDPAIGQLEPLPEVESPERHPERGDPHKTPRASRENLNAAPTDTVIARHVRNVQVPESLAKEYKVKSGLETPHRQSQYGVPGSAATSTVTGRGGRSLTLKEQSSTIERLSKENFDLKLKVMFLSDRLDKLSEEGIKEMISENVDLKMSLAVLQRDNKLLRRRVKELEKKQKDDDERPSTARSGTSSNDQTAKLYDEEAQQREEEILFLRERVVEYETEIEKLHTEKLNHEGEKRRMADIFRSMGDRTGESLSRQEEADVWKDLLEQETARREQADEDNRKLRDELFKMKQDMSGSQAGGLHHTTNIYNITRKQRERERERERNGSPSRPVSGYSGDMDGGGSNTNFSAATTLVEELRKESEQLRHENAELRREVGAQTSMLTSRNREKERLYQEIEDLKMAQRHGRTAHSTADSILDRSASRVGGLDRPISRGSVVTRLTSADEDAERERDELENKLAEARDKLSEVKLQNTELQRELETCMEDFEMAVHGKREAEEQVVALQEDIDNAMNDLVALQSERDEALREQSEMENEFEALRIEAQEEIDALEGEADLRNGELRRLQTELADRSENFDALQEEMRKMSEALIRLEDEQEAKLRRIEQLELDLDSSNRELEELEVKLMEANEKNQRLSVQQESSQGEIAFLREEQESDKIRIGDLEAAVAHLEQTLRDEKEQAKEIEGRLTQEREQREIVANREKEDVQHIINQLNRDASVAKDEARRLRKSLTSREVEVTEWKERLNELENNLGEALGDLNGTRSSFLKVRHSAQTVNESMLTIPSSLLPRCSTSWRIRSGNSTRPRLL